MSWREPGRADYIVLSSLQTGNQEYSRGEGADDQHWYAAAGYPTRNVFRSPKMTSTELLDVIKAAIES